MYVWAGTPTYVEVAAIDLVAGTITPTANGASQYFIKSRGRPDWSADGKYLAYSSCGGLGAGPCTLVVRAMDTGQVRELRPKLQYFFFARWSRDGRSFVTAGTDLKGRRALYRIDAESGEATPVVEKSTVPVQAWSVDGAGVYYGSGDEQHLEIRRHDLASGRDTDVAHVAGYGVKGFFGFSVSPDERTVAVITTPSGDLPEETLAVLPVGGGEPRVLLRVSSPRSLFGAAAREPAWTPDGRAVIVGQSAAAENVRDELWLVPIDGSQPRKLQFNAEHFVGQEGFRLSPDGRQIAFVGQAGAPGGEIRALENVLPSLIAAK